LETMLRIRAFDEKVDELFAAGKMHGTGHFYVGQEAVAVGVISCLREGDVITGTHRGHGHALAFGLELRRMAAELLGKASGYCHGKGGSMHIADVGAGMLGANGIVGGSLGIACGAGWAFKQREEERVAVCFFGDGAVQEGIFSEALNLAALWSLPVVFVCENNHYAMSLSVERGFANPRIAEKAQGYGLPGVAVDGMDLVEVREVAKEAVDRARAGGGPALIEALTYRYLGHSKSDANLYRTRDEIKGWRENDPVLRFAAQLEKTGELLGEDAAAEAAAEASGEAGKAAPTLKEVTERIYAEVEEAFEWAMQEPEPSPESALEDVYA
ncbi:thiamine pyrophosphate-dependent dehydrogenase E1 component subunit alpha, partial [Rubrobacter radiotolerans]